MPEVSLADIDRRLARIEQSLLGNGREGVTNTVARHDERIEVLDERIDGLEDSSRTLTDKVYGIGTAIALLVYATFDQLKGKM
jgi:hypothetical protein